MFSRHSMLVRFFPVSLAAHLVMAFSLTWFATEERTVIPISFGTPGVFIPGNGLPKAAPAPVAKAAPKKVVSAAAPVKDQVTTTAAATAPASAVGTVGSGPGEPGGVAHGTGLGTGKGGGSNDPRAIYGGRLSQMIQQNLHYPRAAKMRNLQGEVMVKISMKRDGRIVSAKVEKSSHEIFKQNAVDTILRVGKFPAVPADIGLDGETVTLILPVKYSLAI